MWILANIGNKPKRRKLSMILRAVEFGNNIPTPYSLNTLNLPFEIKPITQILLSTEKSRIREYCFSKASLELQFLF
jgi:hypothetical protein